MVEKRCSSGSSNASILILAAALFLLACVLVLALAPIAACPYLNTMVHFGKWDCSHCGETSRVTLYHKWKLIRDSNGRLGW
jgi:hypothetical protein